MSNTNHGSLTPPVAGDIVRGAEECQLARPDWISNGRYLLELCASLRARQANESAIPLLHPDFTAPHLMYVSTAGFCDFRFGQQAAALGCDGGCCSWRAAQQRALRSVLAFPRVSLQVGTYYWVY